MRFEKTKFEKLKDGERFFYVDDDRELRVVQKVWCTFWDDIVDDHYTIRGDFNDIPFNAVYDDGMLDWFPEGITVYREV